MRTVIWSMAVLVALVIIVASVLKAKEPARTDTAVPQGEMTVERAAHQATALTTGEILVTGGCAGRSCDVTHASAELYDPATGSFRPVAPMSSLRSGHAAVALPDGRILVMGGWTGQHATASAEAFDPRTGRFSSVGEMVAARMSPVAVSLLDDRVLILGGEERLGAPLASAEVFDPSTSTFSAVGEMQVPRGSHVATALADGRVLVTGGHRARGDILRSAEIFDPATGVFLPTGEMTIRRHKHAAELLADGTVLVIGGSDSRDGGGRYASTEIFDPATGRFSPGPDMNSPRYKLRDAMVGLPSGAVLVAGGATRPEMFDPEDSVFVLVESELSGPQSFATANLLSTGEVLVLGGYNDQIRSSASAWLIDVDLLTADDL